MVGDMMNIEFKSTAIHKYVCRILLKDNITKDDLDTVKRLVINFNALLNDEKSKVMADLKLFNNLEHLSLTLFSITQEDIDILKSIDTLKYITFDLCKINCTLDGHFTSLVLNSCSGIDSNEITMSSLKELKIIEAPGILDLRSILSCAKLKELDILNCNILNINDLLKFEALEKVNLSGSNVDDDSISILSEHMKIIYHKEYHPTGL